MIEHILIISGAFIIGGLVVLTIVNQASKYAIGGVFGW